MQRYREEDWLFLNCNSPADLAAEYRENGEVCLPEYDRCRDGHMLLSGFFTDSQDMEFTTVLESMEDAAGIGLYYGTGSYDNYLLAVVETDRVSLRIPNGVPLGDTFRYEGGKRYYEAGAAKVQAVFPLTLHFRKKNGLVTLRYEEQEVLRVRLPEAAEKKLGGNRHVRLMLKAVNTDKRRKSKAVFCGFAVSGRSRGSQCAGRLYWKADGTQAAMDRVLAAADDIPAAAVSLHLAGFRDKWTVTDKNGNFVLEDIPYGRYICVAGGEETGFRHFELIHDAVKREYVIPKASCIRREGGAQGALSSDAQVVDLNGIWRFDWDKENAGEAEGWYLRGKHSFGRRIEVPFSWQSLQAFGEGFQADAYSLHQNCSWVTNGEEMGGTAWYQRELCVEDDKCMDIVLGAIAGYGTVWLDGRLLGHTENGYNPVRFPLGRLKKGQRYLLTVKVVYAFNNNNCCNGKQGFWFTDAPGIWQNVWLEEARAVRIEDIRIDYELEVYDAHRGAAEVNGRVLLRRNKTNLCEHTDLPDFGRREDETAWPAYVEIHIGAHTRKALVKEESGQDAYAEFTLSMEEVRLWSTEEPYLYTVEALLVGEGETLGKSSRRIGFRMVETKGRQILLNKQPLFIRGVLDQGYNPWGIYTYPCFYGRSRGSMEFDIRKAKEYGYNLIRMHIKDNEPQWYSLCDELGMLVWDEHPSNFYGTWDNALWRQRYAGQLKSMIRKHNYHPSVILFSVFNESWGITGGHEMSPWEETEAQDWQREMARFYKEGNKQALTIDNSGYAKTGETQMLDYHMYPETYLEARDFFCRMTRQNYAGSPFNCYNRENREFLQEDGIRELLQRNCSMDLSALAYKGDEAQEEQPVIISEFVHTNQIEQLVRILPGVAGYTRMNLASQENEDTSPLTNIRTERDFGFVHEDYSAAGYAVINSRNLILADYPPLTRQRSGEGLRLPIYLSLWEEGLSGKPLTLRIVWKGTDESGCEGIVTDRRETAVTGRCYEPFRAKEVAFVIPEGMKALYMFYSLYDGERLICENSLQMEIIGQPEEGMCRREEGGGMAAGRENRIIAECKAAEPFAWTTDSFKGCYEKEGRQLLWMSGAGVLTYRLPLETYSGGGAVLQIEASACECMEGTRLTDEVRYPGRLKLSIGRQETALTLPDAPSDRRGIFSNSAAIERQEFAYKRSGKWGYGYQLHIPVGEAALSEAADKGYLEVRIECDSAGAVIYGRRMGRYGTNPALVKRMIFENMEA